MPPKKPKFIVPDGPFEYNPEIHGKMCPRGTRRKGKMCVPNANKQPPLKIENEISNNEFPIGNIEEEVASSSSGSDSSSSTSSSGSDSSSSGSDSSSSGSDSSSSGSSSSSSGSDSSSSTSSSGSDSSSSTSSSGSDSSSSTSSSGSDSSSSSSSSGSDSSSSSSSGSDSSSSTSSSGSDSSSSTSSSGSDSSSISSSSGSDSSSSSSSSGSDSSSSTSSSGSDSSSSATPAIVQPIIPSQPKKKTTIKQKPVAAPFTDPFEYNPAVHGKMCPRGTRRKGKMCVPHAPKPKAVVSTPVINREAEYKLTIPVDVVPPPPVEVVPNASDSSSDSSSTSDTSSSTSDTSSSTSGTSSSTSGTSDTSSEATVVNTQEEVQMPVQDSNFNAFLKSREKIESQQLIDGHDFLYPDLNDLEFNIKIAMKKEFADAQYDGKIYDIEKQANLLCSAKFELSPHQSFVRNFLSAQTPYNGLLLYHGLGTGKTCSAIGVAEEMRQYLKSVGLRDKILVVASPNVQANFRTQLFDDRKLMKYTNVANQNEYTWNIESCVGNTLLQEINPNSIRNLSREKLVSNINTLINDSYSFMGYIQLANLITSVIGQGTANKSGKTNGKKENRDARSEEVHNIRQFFDGKLIIIDEVHNIRLSEDNSRKELQQVAALLMRVAKHAVGMRLLLLSATPMFNSYKEIVWITNLLNMNDKRSTIQVADIFDAEGNWKEDGQDILQRKLTGYVSYVRGENPYTFPFRVYPPVFAPDRALDKAQYPTIQMNGAKIAAPIEHLQLYVNRLSKTTYQSRTYLAMMEYIRKRANGYYTTKGKYREMPSFENMESFGYIMLQKPIEALNVVYPNDSFEKVLNTAGGEDLKAAQWNDALFEDVVGKNGLANAMTFETMYQGNPLKHDFEYKPEILRKYGRIFSEEKVANYSAKIAEILRIIRRSEGVVLIYSQFIDGGIIPIALALEEMGFTKYSAAPGAKQLFKKRPSPPIDAITLKPIEKGSSNASAAQYIVITGDKGISASNTDDVKFATSRENMDGSKVKVVLVSKAGSEGIDFKFIRQVHAFDAWFNMNRLEQVIGRGVRNLSHCALPFKKRNVQIYLHATMFEGSEEEPADLYLYRLAEKKAVQIGRVSRLIKECAADCILHIGQTNFTVQKLAELAQNQTITIELSTRDEISNQPVEIPFQVGDKEGTEMCDYMTCEYQCRAGTQTVSEPPNKETADKSAYTVHNASRNHAYIVARIKELYRENHAYTLKEIVAQINLLNVYPIEQILFLLSRIVNNKSEYLFDKYGRFGYVIQRGKYYVFQPIEIGDERVSVYNRARPVEWKRDRFAVELPASLRRIVGPEDPTATAIVGHAAPSAAASAAQQGLASSMDAEQIVRDIQAKVEETKRSGTIIKSEEKDWYKNASKVMHTLKFEYGIDETRLVQYVVEHAIESLGFDEKLALMMHVHGKTVFYIDPIVETVAANYFNRWKMRHKVDRFSVGIYLSDKETNHLYVFEPTESSANSSESNGKHSSESNSHSSESNGKHSSESNANSWRRGDEIDMANFDTTKYNINKRLLHRMIGYIINFKDQDMAFYYKDITLQRNKRGRRCDRAGGKAPVYESLNLFLEKEAYTQQNTANIYGGGLCVIMEMLMRHYNNMGREGKIYLLTPEQAIKTQITNFSAPSV